MNSRALRDSALRLHHVCVFAADMDRSISFYRDAFGATRVAEWEEVVDSSGQKFPGRGAFLQLANSGFVEIFPADPKSEALEFPRRALNHICFATNDCARDYKRAIASGATPYMPARAREKGVDWDGSPKTMFLGDAGRTEVRIAYLKGPDGETIELMETDSALLGLS